jgi:hypothetical protein
VLLAAALDVCEKHARVGLAQSDVMSRDSRGVVVGSRWLARSVVVSSELPIPRLTSSTRRLCVLASRRVFHLASYPTLSHLDRTTRPRPRPSPPSPPPTWCANVRCVCIRSTALYASFSPSHLSLPLSLDALPQSCRVIRRPLPLTNQNLQQSAST